VALPLDLHELEEQARQLLQREVYDYIAGGAMDEVTLEDNVAAWSRKRLRPRVLRDVADVRVDTTVLGRPVAHPIGVAPTAFHRLVHPDAEPATAAGAADAGAIYTMSTRSTTPLEEVAAATGAAPWWLQLYVLREQSFSDLLVDRAVAAGASAIVLTGDTPVLGRRLRDLRNNWIVPTDVGVIESFQLAGDGAEQSASLTFDAVARIVERAKVPVVVKGVLRGDDARRCVDAGASAIWVSNHGGRQLDGAIATAEALAEVVDAVGGGTVEVYVDGGVRRGTDVLRALAIGATAVFVGRPVVWGLTVGGRDGVRGVLDGLVDELILSMALAGCATVTDVTRDLLAT
jgi:4-hydroxymandelate oxidase